jgi:tetrahydromethanopterin S-methyltransferase subunit G
VEGLTRREKKILLGESTFLSIGFVISIILAVVYTVNIDGKSNANAKTLTQNTIELQEFRKQYINQMTIYTNEIKELNNRLGRIEGKLDVIKQ